MHCYAVNESINGMWQLGLNLIIKNCLTTYLLFFLTLFLFKEIHFFSKKITGLLRSKKCDFLSFSFLWKHDRKLKMYSLPELLTLELNNGCVSMSLMKCNKEVSLNHVEPSPVKQFFFPFMIFFSTLSCLHTFSVFCIWTLKL